MGVAVENAYEMGASLRFLWEPEGKGVGDGSIDRFLTEFSLGSSKI